MANRKGRVTIPTDLDVVPQTKEIMERWLSLIHISEPTRH